MFAEGGGKIIVTSLVVCTCGFRNVRSNSNRHADVLIAVICFPVGDGLAMSA